MAASRVENTSLRLRELSTAFRISKTLCFESDGIDFAAELEHRKVCPSTNLFVARTCEVLEHFLLWHSQPDGYPPDF